MKLSHNSQIKSVQVEAVIIRANGQVEPIGTISYWHRNPLRRAWFWIKNSWRKAWPRSL